MLTPPHLLTALFLFPVCADRICPDAPSGYPGSIPSEDHFRINVVQGYAPSLSYASSKIFFQEKFMVSGIKYIVKNGNSFVVLKLWPEDTH